MKLFRFVKQHVLFLVDVGVPSRDASELHLLHSMYNI